MIEGLVTESHEEKLQKLDLFNLGRILSLCVNVSWEGIKKMKPDVFSGMLSKITRRNSNKMK